MPDFTTVNAELDDRTQFLVGLRDTTFFDIEPGSALALDDAAVAPLRFSAIVRSTFVAATDSLASPGVVAPTFALLRSALECAAVTIWLLESDDPAVRATRLLSDVWGDIRDSDRLATALNGVLESLSDQERDWKASHTAVFGDAEVTARQMPTSMAAKIDVAAGVVADFTRVPNMAAVVRSSWQAFGSLARGRAHAFDLPDDALAMTAGSRSLVLDVLETAASLYRVRAVGPAPGR
jgi:hypothetical protein